MKPSKKPSLEEYDEDLPIKKENIPTSLPELSEYIEQRLWNKPKTKDRNSRRVWRKEVNYLINLYNEKSGFRAFSNIH